MTKQQYVISLLDVVVQRGDLETGMLPVLHDLKHYAKYAIPPIYRNAINRMQLPLLDLAADVVATHRTELYGRTDVILCAQPNSDRQLQNHYRVTSNALIRELMAAVGTDVQSQLAAYLPKEQGSSHDKVGEMATTMATRIAQSCQLDGRAIAIDSGESCFAAALTLASDALHCGKSDAVLILLANEQQHVSGDMPLSVGAVLLKRSKLENVTAKAYLHNTQALSQLQLQANVTNDEKCRVDSFFAPLEQLQQWLYQPSVAMSWGLSDECNETDVDAIFSRDPKVFEQSSHTQVELNAQQVWFANCQGNSAFWQGLNNEQGGIGPVPHQTFAGGQVFAPNGATFDSYYNQTGALLEPIVRNKTGHADLHAVLDSVLQQFPAISLPAESKGIVITASNLAPFAARRVCLVNAFNELCAQLREVLESHHEATALETLAQWQQELCDVSIASAKPAWHLSQRIALHFNQPHWSQHAIEAACAGSMAALDCAVNAIQSGRVDFAFVAGIEMPINLHDLCLCSSQQMLSHQVIATFSEQADGFTPGEGCAVVLLSRTNNSNTLPKLAVIEAIGSSTFSKSMIAPNSDGQIAAMRHAFAQTTLRPTEIEFIETHGTGTPIGDLVETDAIAAVYQSEQPDAFSLGALKTQFGHTFAAAGLASVCKVALCFEHQWQPHNLLKMPLRDELQLAERGFNPLAEGRAFLAPRGQRHAAVNGFGTGGVNYHLLMRDFYTS